MNEILRALRSGVAYSGKRVGFGRLSFRVFWGKPKNQAARLMQHKFTPIDNTFIDKLLIIVGSIRGFQQRDEGVLVRELPNAKLPARKRSSLPGRFGIGGQGRDRTADAGLFRAALYH